MDLNCQLLGGKIQLILRSLLYSGLLNLFLMKMEFLKMSSFSSDDVFGVVELKF